MDLYTIPTSSEVINIGCMKITLIVLDMVIHYTLPRSGKVCQIMSMDTSMCGTLLELELLTIHTSLKVFNIACTIYKGDMGYAFKVNEI